MLKRIKTRRFNRSVRRLHKAGVKNMVTAYDLCNHASYVLSK